METHRLRRTRNLVIAAGLVWTALVVLASASGWLRAAGRYAPPLTAASVMLTIVSLSFALPSFRAWVASLGLVRLTALHILRIAAVPLFFWYGSRGLLPAVFVSRAAWGDLAAGLLALGVLLFWRRPAGFWIAHLWGMSDFFIAFATAIPLARQGGSAMESIATLPIALIPFVGVPFLAATHVMAYDLLLRTRNAVITREESKLTEAM